MSWLKQFAFVSALLLSLPTVAARSACFAIDGDTLVCGKERIRLANVYAAERNEPGGAAAKARLSGLIRSGQVNIKRVGKDKYGRTIANVSVNGRPVSQPDFGPRAGHGAEYKPWRAPQARGLPSQSRAKFAPRPKKPKPYVSKSFRQPTHVRGYITRNGRYVSGHHRKG